MERYLEFKFQEYQAIVAPDAGANQSLITRDAFYAGATVLMKVFKKTADDLTEDQGVEVLDHMDGELTAWREECARRLKELRG